MAITFDSSGRPAYMFKGGATSSDGVWYPVGAKIDTTAAYEFTGANTFTNTVGFDDAVIASNGFNNFLNPAARDAALATPVRGTIAFVRQDSGGAALNQIQFYDGSAWVGSGDIFGVTAGTGISGGGTSGTVTITNSMATTIDAKGDLIAGTADNAFSRIAVGTNGYFLKANSATATGLEWSELTTDPTPQIFMLMGA